MNTFIKSLLIISTLNLLLAGCKTKEYSNPNEVIIVKSQKEFVIKLASNPTTGYKWHESSMIDTNLLQLKFIDYKVSEPQLVGSGGFEYWHFKAIKPGKTIINLKYFRSWEVNSEVNQKQFIVEIRK